MGMRPASRMNEFHWRPWVKILAGLILLAVVVGVAAYFGAKAAADPGCGIDAPGVCAPYTPGMATPAPSPPLPTYIVNADGSRMTCTPNFQFCWKDGS